MAKLGITFENVEKACRKLTENQMALTMENVRRELGGTGSFSSIHKHLKVIKHEIKTETINSIVHFEMSPGFKQKFEKSAAEFWAMATADIKAQYELKHNEMKTFLENSEANGKKEKEEFISEVERLEREIQSLESSKILLSEQLNIAKATAEIFEKKLTEKESEWKTQIEKTAYFQAQVDLLKEKISQLEAKADKVSPS